MGMIARRWSGSVRAEDSEPYQAYLLDTGLKDYRNTPGNLGSQLLRRVEEDLVHFEITSFWKDEESIRLFAGEDIGKAVFYPMDERYLVRKDERVAHFELAFLEGPRSLD